MQLKKRDDYMNYEGNVHVSSRFFLIHINNRTCHKNKQSNPDKQQYINTKRLQNVRFSLLTDIFSNTRLKNLLT